jgi:hypothetical protein
MLQLAATRTQGAHPYLVTPEHTARARSILGEGPLLCPEQALVLETDARKAREIARRHGGVYLAQPNYAWARSRVFSGRPSPALRAGRWFCWGTAAAPTSVHRPWPAAHTGS